MSSHQARAGILAACAAVLLLATPASAAIQSTATLSNFSWSLTDLNPLDTTAPALSFIGTGINDASANSYSTLFETHGCGATGGTGDVSASAPLVAGQTAQAAVTTGTVGQPPLSLFASGTTMPSAPGSFGQFDAQATSRDWVFTLAPHTQVTFYATSNLNVALTGGGARHRLHHPGDRKHSAGAAQPGNRVGGVRQPDGQRGHRVSVCHGLCLRPLAGRAGARA